MVVIIFFSDCGSKRFGSIFNSMKVKPTSIIIMGRSRFRQSPVSVVILNRCLFPRKIIITCDKSQLLFARVSDGGDLFRPKIPTFLFWALLFCVK